MHCVRNNAAQHNDCSRHPGNPSWQCCLFAHDAISPFFIVCRLLLSFCLKYRNLKLLLHPRHAHSHHALPALPQAFFARPAELVAPDLFGCLMWRRQCWWRCRREISSLRIYRFFFRKNKTRIFEGKALGRFIARLSCFTSWLRLPTVIAVIPDGKSVGCQVYASISICIRGNVVAAIGGTFV